MALQTPKYQGNARLPGSLGQPFVDLRGAQALGGAITGLGDVIAKRALQLQEEEDVLVANNAFIEFKDAARGKLTELEELDGEQAFGLGDKYDKWFRDKVESYEQGRFNTGRQKELFRNVTQRERDNDLNSLANTEQRKREVLKVQQEKALLVTFSGDAREIPINDPEYDNRIQNVIDLMNMQTDPTHQGETEEMTEARHKRNAGVILSAAMDRLLTEDPSRAAEQLEKWKEALGPAYDIYEPKIAVELKKQQFNNLLSGAEIEHPKDFDSQVDWINKQKDVDAGLRQRAVEIVHSKRRESERRTKEYIKDQREIFSNELFKNIREGNNIGAFLNIQDVPDVIVPQGEKLKLENALNNKLQSETTEDDEAVKNAWWKQIQKDPDSVDEIALIEDDRIVSGTKDWLISQLEYEKARAKGKSKRELLDPFRDVEAKNIFQLLDNKYKNGEYNKDDRELNRLGWLDDESSFLNWMKENPGKQPNEWYKERYYKEPETSGWKGVFDSFKTGVGIITNPVGQFLEMAPEGTLEELEFWRKNPGSKPKTIVDTGTVRGGPDDGKRIEKYSDGTTKIIEPQDNKSSDERQANEWELK